MLGVADPLKETYSSFLEPNLTRHWVSRQVSLRRASAGPQATLLSQKTFPSSGTQIPTFRRYICSHLFSFLAGLIYMSTGYGMESITAFPKLVATRNLPNRDTITPFFRNPSLFSLQKPAFGSLPVSSRCGISRTTSRGSHPPTPRRGPGSARTWSAQRSSSKHPRASPPLVNGGPDPAECPAQLRQRARAHWVTHQEAAERAKSRELEVRRSSGWWSSGNKFGKRQLPGRMGGRVVRT